MRQSTVSKKAVSFREALKVWLRVALYSFGGPAGQIAIMHKFLVEEKKWISDHRFLHALNYCMLLPGPEAQQLATYIGWLLHKTRGGLAAGILFVMPGFAAILILSMLYAAFQEVAFVQGLFYGIKPAVLAIVVGAVIKIAKKALKNEVMHLLAALAFIGIFFFEVEFPYIVIAAGVIGYFGGKFWEEKFYVIKEHAANNKSEDALIDSFIQAVKPSWKKALSTAAVWLALWFVPIGIVALLLGGDHIFVQESIFFSKTAVVTFGGAYTVIPFIQQDAVINNAWMSNEQFLDGIALSGILPAPLIIFSTFVGYFGGGWLGAVIITFAIFLPAFCFTLIGHNLVEKVIENKALHNFLDGITAGVIGLIAVTAIQLFRSTIGNWFSLIIFVVSLFVLYRVKSKFTVIFVIIESGLLSLLYHPIM